MINISKYLDKGLVTFVDAGSRDEAIKAMVDYLAAADKLMDRQVFYDAIMEREKIVSTGIGMGVAIPHAKLAEYEDFFVLVALLRKSVDWNSIDGAPVKLIFMIGGPDDKQTEYLQILSALTMLIKEEDRRKKMLTANSADDIMKTLDRPYT